MTRWFQAKLAASMVVAAWCTASGSQATAQGPAAGEDDYSRVPGAAWTTVKPETRRLLEPASREPAQLARRRSTPRRC